MLAVTDYVEQLIADGELDSARTVLRQEGDWLDQDEQADLWTRLRKAEELQSDDEVLEASA